MTLYAEFAQVQYIDLSDIVQFGKAGIIVISVHLKISTLCVISHVLSAKMSPEWRRSNPGFGTKFCVPYMEVSFE